MVKSTQQDHLSCHTIATVSGHAGNMGPDLQTPLRRHWLAFGFVLALALWLMPARSAWAQGQGSSRSLGSIGFGGSDNSPHTPPEHMVQGTVQDKEGKAIPGAIVYLRKAQNHEVSMVVADEKGAYRFGPLALDTDYTVWAQVGEKKGPIRPISSFSTGPLTMQLKVE